NAARATAAASPIQRAFFIESFQVFRGINSPGFVLDLDNADAVSMLQRSQLLQPLRDLQSCSLQFRKLAQKTDAINIQTDVERTGPSRWNSRAGKIERHSL